MKRCTSEVFADSARLLACGTVACFAQASLAQISVFTDRIEFLAATGGSSATGPLPDLGLVVTSATVGTITFSLAAGGDTLAIGASGIPSVIGGDWYPPTPGHDIALGYENLMVETQTPVYALGFDLVEPDLTMPSWGGVPVNTTFEVTLFSGGVQVAQFTFDAPDDVPAFVGVWSREAFDSATIVDLDMDDDDEYFGEFYSGTTPMPAPCYANCDGSTSEPVLNVNDFICFQSRFAAADPHADCDQSGTLNVNDFICFQALFAAGCP